MPFDIQIDEAKLWGYKKGLKKGLCEAIALGLELKFGKKASTLMKEIKKIDDIKKLKKLKEVLVKAKTLEQFEKEIMNQSSIK